MPRNIRPVWVSVAIDHTSNDPVPVKATGPRSRTGSATVNVKVRDRGSVLDLLDVDCIGSADGSTVLVRVTDRRTGKVLFSEQVAQ